MTDDVGRTGRSGTARRPGPAARTAAAVLLLVAGGTAVAVGVSGRDAAPTPAVATAPSPAPEPVAEARSGGTPPAGPSATPTPAPSAAPAAPVAAPVSVSIPAIDVDSELLHLGLNPDGTLEVPQGPDFDTAAWYDGSPRPGEVGPAVIEGHVSGVRGPSVFFDLGRLVVGDLVEVTREDGTVATFEVYDVQQFPKDSFPTVQVYGATAGPELRVITCGGTVRSNGLYEDNVIVFARQV